MIQFNVKNANADLFIFGCSASTIWKVAVFFFRPHFVKVKTCQTRTKSRKRNWVGRCVVTWKRRLSVQELVVCGLGFMEIGEGLGLRGRKYVLCHSHALLEYSLTHVRCVCVYVYASTCVCACVCVWTDDNRTNKGHKCDLNVMLLW